MRRPGPERLWRWGLTAAAVGLGGAGLLAFGGFLWRGALGRFDLGLGAPAALAWDAALSLVFFVQHSGMVRRGVRCALDRWLPRGGQGALYTVASGVVLLLVVGLWQRVDPPLLAATGPWRQAVQGLFLAAGAAMAWGATAIPGFDLLGLDGLWRRGAPAATKTAAGSPAACAAESVAAVRPSQRFVVRGPYRWVRHPLYTLSLIMIWAFPDLAADRLLFDLLWSAWIAVATRWEERDLVARFGDVYRAYQAAVPRLVPRPWRAPHPRV